MGHVVDERVLQLLAGGMGRVVGEWGGRTERAVAGGEHVSTGGARRAGMLVQYSLVCVEGVLRRPTKRISVCHPVDWEDKNHLREDDCRSQERRLFQ